MKEREVREKREREREKEEEREREEREKVTRSSVNRVGVFAALIMRDSRGVNRFPSLRPLKGPIRIDATLRPARPAVCSPGLHQPPRDTVTVTLTPALHRT